MEINPTACICFLQKADAPQQAESAEASGKAPTQETETKSSGKEGSSEVADPQEGLKTDEPPKSDVLDSIHQSEAICDPKAAMAIEEEGNPHKKGEATPASEDKKSSSEDSEEGAEPSQKEILESIHQAEVSSTIMSPLPLAVDKSVP